MQPGDRVAGRFEILAAAGMGGMATVYRAADVDAGGKAVALKLLHVADPAERERFRREAQVLAELSHPGIVRHVAHGFDARGFPYLVMEWLEGETLSARLKRAGISPTESVVLGKCVAAALSHAHAHGVVHRDLKPGNLFLPDGDVARTKIIDFGIVHLAAATQVLTQTGVSVGTPVYMSPEQVSGDKQIDGRSDLFSLGSVLYACLTGTPAFQGGDMLAVIAKILLEDPPSPAETRSDVPPAFADLVMRLLCKRPEDRPASAQDVVDALTALSDSTTPVPAAPSASSLTEEERLFVSLVLCVPRVRSRTTRTLSPRDGASMWEIANRYGSALDRLGDGSAILTIRGSGSPTDHAAAAARAALALSTALPWRGISVTSGRGIVKSRLPMGEVIERAASLLRSGEPIPPQGGVPILVDQATASLLGTRFDLQETDSGTLLAGETEDAEPVRTLLKRPTPCVGRERQLAALLNTYDECVEEPVARAVVVTGAPGMGKSRLRQELVRALLRQQPAPTVWLARGHDVLSGSAFAILAELTRRAAGIAAEERGAGAQRRLLEFAASYVEKESAARVAEFLGELIGVESDASGSEQLALARRDPILKGDQMRRAVQDLMAAAVARGPLVIVLEDLHWGDPSSVGILDTALRVLAETPLFVVAFARPEVHDTFPGLWSERGVQNVALNKLTRRACNELIRAVLGDEIPTDAADRIAQRADGNAFYLEELIRAYAEGAHDVLPETVIAMAQARLENLDADARRVLRAASVFGETFWANGVQALLGAHNAGVMDWLTALVDQEVIVKHPASRLGPEDELAFRHGLLREAAYASLTEDDRVLGHGLAGQWLAQAGERDPMVLASHYDLGGDATKARAMLAPAAEQALQGNDFSACLERVQRAVELGAADEELGRLRRLSAEAARWVGRVDDAAHWAEEAMHLLPAESNPWYEAAAELATDEGQRANLAGLVKLCELIQERPLASHAASAQLSAWARLAGNLLMSGRRDLAQSLLAQTGTYAEGHADPSVSARLYNVEALIALADRALERALAAARAATSNAERAGELRLATTLQVSAGYCYLVLGQTERGVQALRVARERAEQMGLDNVAAAADHNLGLALARLGQLEDGIETEARAAEACQRHGDRAMEAASRAYLARILHWAGRLDEAERESRLAVDLAENRPSIQMLALAELSKVLRVRGDQEQALTVVSDALEIFREHGGMEEGASWLWLEAAEARRACGDGEGAREAIREAARLLHEAARTIDDPGFRASFLQIPEHQRIRELEHELG